MVFNTVSIVVEGVVGLFTRDSITEYERREIGREATSTILFPASEGTRTVLGVPVAVETAEAAEVAEAVGVAGVVERTRMGVDVDRVRFGFSGVETRVKEDTTVVSVTCGIDCVVVDGGIDGEMED